MDPTLMPIIVTLLTCATAGPSSLPQATLRFDTRAVPNSMNYVVSMRRDSGAGFARNVNAITASLAQPVASLAIACLV